MKCSICGKDAVAMVATDLLDCHHEVNIYEFRCKDCLEVFKKEEVQE